MLLNSSGKHKIRMGHDGEEKKMDSLGNKKNILKKITGLQKSRKRLLGGKSSLEKGETAIPQPGGETVTTQASCTKTKKKGGGRTRKK